jgi:hypothetical protein
MIDDEDDLDFDFNAEFSDEENAEFEKEQKEEAHRLKTHPLFVQAKEVLHIVDVLLDTCQDEMVKKSFTETLGESATIILAKLSSGLTSKSYVQCMQKASIIRDHAEYMRLSNHMLSHLKAIDPKYIKLFREEMEKFRELFKLWASEIHKMEPDYEDEDWGLFIKS